MISNKPPVLEHEPNLDALHETKCNALEERIRKLPHVLRMGDGHWYAAINRAIDLLEHPNNLDALWVWSRFLFAFGRFDTWEADTGLDKLIYFERLRASYELRLSTLPRRQWLKRRKCRKQLAQATNVVHTILNHVITNSKNWPDREAFEAHKGKSG